MKRFLIATLTATIMPLAAEKPLTLKELQEHEIVISYSDAEMLLLDRARSNPQARLKVLERIYLNRFRYWLLEFQRSQAAIEKMQHDGVYGGPTYASIWAKNDEDEEQMRGFLNAAGDISKLADAHGIKLPKQ